MHCSSGLGLYSAYPAACITNGAFCSGTTLSVPLDRSARGTIFYSRTDFAHCDLSRYKVSMMAAANVCMSHRLCVRRLRDETKPFAPWDTVVLQREAVTTVVDLIVGHPPNAACLLGLTDLCISVFTEYLSTCGDFGVQVL